MISYIKKCLFLAPRYFFKCVITIIIVENFQGKVILDGTEFRVSKIIYNDICIKEHGLWGWGLICKSMSLNILRCTIAANAFSSYLETHKVSRLGANLHSTPGSCYTKHLFISNHFPSTGTLPLHFKLVLGRWPLKYFVLES